MLGRIHQSNFASSHCQLTLPDRQSCKTIEFARAATSTLGRMALAMPELEQQLRSARDLRGRGARPHGRRGHEDRAPLPHGARPQRARSRPLFDLEGPAPPPPPPPPPCQPRLGERAMASRATSPLPGLMSSLRSPGSRRPRPPPATGPRDRSHRPAAAVRRVHCCHCATDCAGATRLRGLGAAAVAGPLTLRRPRLRAAWGVRGGARGAQRPPWHVFSARSSLEAMRPCGAWQLACSALDAENALSKRHNKKSLYIREVQQAVLL